MLKKTAQKHQGAAWKSGELAAPNMQVKRKEEQTRSETSEASAQPAKVGQAAARGERPAELNQADKGLKTNCHPNKWQSNDFPDADHVQNFQKGRAIFAKFAPKAGRQHQWTLRSTPCQQIFNKGCLDTSKTSCNEPDAALRSHVQAAVHGKSRPHRGGARALAMERVRY